METTPPKGGRSCSDRSRSHSSCSCSWWAPPPVAAAKVALRPGSWSAGTAPWTRRPAFATWPARGEDDRRRRRAHERRARAPVRDDPRGVRDSARRVRRHGGGNFPRREDAGARGRRDKPERDALRRPEHENAPAPEGDHSSRPVGVRRPVAERPDALRDPVLRHRGECALQRPCGEPRHRQAGWWRARRQARAGRGDERLRRRRVSAARTGSGPTRSTRSPTAPASCTRSTRPAGAPSASTCRGARATSASRRSASGSRTAAAPSSWRSRAGTGSQSSTPRPSR